MNEEKFNFICSIADELVDRFRFSHEVAYFVGCQFALESNFGNSRIAKTNNNFCGMKVAYSRITCQCVPESGSTFGKYFCKLDCIIDFVLRMQYFRPVSDDYQKLGAYQKFNEKSCYCPEKGYNARINNIYQQFKTYYNERKK